MLRDLSSQSWRWYNRVYEAALKYYHDYQQSDPLTRGLLRPDLPEDLQHHTFARLESRAVSMLLHAVPESVSSQALATRSLSTVGLLFQILKQYQPGGLGERQELLKSLTDLNPAASAGEAVLLLQAWFRHVARARTMKVQLPDGSLLLAALDTLAKNILAENSQVAFRVSLNRHQLRLDYRANLELVEAYARNLMAEFEVVSLAHDTSLSPKKSHVRKAKEKSPGVPPTQSAPLPGSTPPPVANPGASPPRPPPKAPASSKPCVNWLTDEGCHYGSKCRFLHDKETELLKGRCFFCSAKSHWANACPIKAAEKQEESSKASPKAKSQATGRAEGKGKAGGKGNPGVRALESSNPAEEPTSSEQPAPSDNVRAKSIVVDAPNPTQELAKEVTEVLRSLRLRKLEVVGPAHSVPSSVRVSSLPQSLAEGAAHGLIDSGATAALRTGSQTEIAAATPVSVQLAVGEARMFANAYGTLLTPNNVQPILPMAFLPDLGCTMTWTDRGCSVKHPRKGLLPVRLSHQCPELPVNLVLELINDHEELQEQKRATQVRAKTAVAAALNAPAAIHDDPMAWIRSKVHNGQLSMADQAQWLAKLFPELPQRILERVICPVGFNVDRVPFNRHDRRKLFNSKLPTLLHLFSGAQRWSDCGHVLHVEKEKGSDLLSNDVFGMILQAVLSGSLEGCVGGPPCNTVSACRMADDGGPRQVRSREGPERYGLYSNTPAEQASVDDASVLWFRTLVLFLLISAIQGPRAFLGLEHPEDPARWSNHHSPLQRCPSLWVFPELAYVKELINAFRADFDQGHFGHPRKKPTSLMTTSWAVFEELSAHRCVATGKPFPLSTADLLEEGSHPQVPGRYPSAAWARWAPGLVKILKEGWIHHCHTSLTAILQFQEERQAKLQALSPSWRAHVAADHHPYRKDCEICLQAASRDRPHFRQTESSFYAMSADISGPFASGKDVGGPRRYFVAFSIRLPVGDDFPWTRRDSVPEVFPKSSAHSAGPRVGAPHPVSGPPTQTYNLNPCSAGQVLHEESKVDLQVDEQEDSSSIHVKAGPLRPTHRVRGKSSPMPVLPDSLGSGPPDLSSLEMEFSRDGVPDLGDAPASLPASSPSGAPGASADPVDFIQDPEVDSKLLAENPLLTRGFVTLRWAEPLQGRSADQLRLVIMQSIAKCKAFGIPVLRFHTDRAKEFQSVKLLRWLAEQSIHATKSAPEDPAANGTAEASVREIKRSARRCLLSSGLPSVYWPLAVRHASELSWRLSLARLGCPTRPLLAFGTKVEARSREWIKRSDKQWSQRTLSGQLVGPAPHTPSAYVVLLGNGHLYISSSVHPVTSASHSLASPDAVPPCVVQLKLFRAAANQSPFCLPPPIPSSPVSMPLPRPSVRVLRSAAPSGGGGVFAGSMKIWHKTITQTPQCLP